MLLHEALMQRMNPQLDHAWADWWIIRSDTMRFPKLYVLTKFQSCACLPQGRYLLENKFFTTTELNTCHLKIW